MIKALPITQVWMDSDQRWVTSPLRVALTSSSRPRLPLPRARAASLVSPHKSHTCVNSFCLPSSFGVAAADVGTYQAETGRRGHSPALRHMYNVSVSRLSATYWRWWRVMGCFPDVCARRSEPPKLNLLECFRVPSLCDRSASPKSSAPSKNEFPVAPALIYVWQLIYFIELFSL